MIDFETIPETVRINCENLGFGAFYILAVPEGEDSGCNASGEEYAYYLCHKQYSVVLHMFSDFADSPKEVVERAYHNAAHYIPDFIKECFRET